MHSSPEVQLSLEMVLSHVLLPLLFERLRYGDYLFQLVKWVVRWASPVLGLVPFFDSQIFPVVPLPVTLPVPVPEEVPQELVEGEGEGVAVDMEGVERENNEETEFAETLPNLNDEAEEEELHLLQGEDENELKDRDVIPPPPPPPPAAATPFPSSQQAVPAPSHVPSFHAMHLLPLELRVSMLALLLCCTLGLMSSWLLHWPLSLGRLILPFLGLSGTNKIVNYPIGLGALYMVARACVAVLRDLQHRLLGADVAPADRLVLATRLVNKWGLVVSKVSLAAALWISLPPLLLGYLFMALFVLPWRVRPEETPIYSFLQLWAFGLVGLKLGARCILTGVLGDIDLRLQLEMVMIRGVEHFQLRHFLDFVLWPVLQPLLDTVCWPFLCSRLLACAMPSHGLRTLCVRYSYHFYLLLRLLVHLLRRTTTYLVTLHNEIRDSRYLVGMQLTNRDPR